MSPERTGPRLRDAMPRPLLLVFAALSLATLGIVLVLLVRPPTFETVALEERRPAPADGRSHDGGRLIPVPLPSPLPAVPAPRCPAVARTRILAGALGTQRIDLALAEACRLSGAGVDPEVARAVRALDGLTIRFATFEITGLESAFDANARTIWLNLKLGAKKVPVGHVVPVLVHEAWHAADAGEPDARDELTARRVEAAVCRQVVPIKEWPRWCRDAAQIADMPEARALMLLRRAGYE